MHTDKAVAAIADCAKAIKTLGNGNGSDEMQQLFSINRKSNTTQYIHFSNTYNNIVRPINFEGAAEQQQQQATSNNINDTSHATIFDSIHTRSYNGGTTNGSQMKNQKREVYNQNKIMKQT